MRCFAHTDNIGVNGFGQWIVETCCLIPVLRTLPLRSPFRRCTEVIVTWRRLYHPERATWSDWFIPFDTPYLTIWRNRP